MRYDNLQALLSTSSSSRQFFLSLPVSVQVFLHEKNEHIHSAADLHILASAAESYRHAEEISNMGLPLSMHGFR